MKKVILSLSLVVSLVLTSCGNTEPQIDITNNEVMLEQVFGKRSSEYWENLPDNVKLDTTYVKRDDKGNAKFLIVSFTKPTRWNKGKTNDDLDFIVMLNEDGLAMHSDVSHINTSGKYLDYMLAPENSSLTEVISEINKINNQEWSAIKSIKAEWEEPTTLTVGYITGYEAKYSFSTTWSHGEYSWKFEEDGLFVRIKGTLHEVFD